MIDVSTFSLDTRYRLFQHVQNSSPDCGSVPTKDFNLMGDSLLDIIQRVGRCGVDLGLEPSPQEEVERRHVRWTWRPFNFAVEGYHSITEELGEALCDIPGAMARCPILRPPYASEPSIPATAIPCNSIEGRDNMSIDHRLLLVGMLSVLRRCGIEIVGL